MRFLRSKYSSLFDSRFVWNTARLACFVGVVIFKCSKTFSKLPPALHTGTTVTHQRHQRCETWVCVQANGSSFDFFESLNEIVSPFTPWFVADFYWGDELEYILGRDVINTLHARGLQRLINCGAVPLYSLLYVQTDQFEQWANECLPLLQDKIVLLTGKWHLPQIHRSNVSEFVLMHPKILLWASQNPIFDHKKYLALPYGIRHTNIAGVIEISTSTKVKKVSILAHMGLAPTHPDRARLPRVDKLPLRKYLETLQQSSFVISPMGDRPDAYRHWEALALETIPVCNCPPEMKQLFGKNMVFATIDEIQAIINHPNKLLNFQDSIVVQTDVLSVGYWMKILLQRVKELKD